MLTMTGSKAPEPVTISGFLRVTGSLPLDLLTDACERLTETWGAEQFGAPKPGDLMTSARAIRRERAEAQQSDELRENLAEARSANPGQAAYLADLGCREREPLPAESPDDWHLALRTELAVRASKRRICGLPPKPEEDRDLARLCGILAEEKGQVPGFASIASALEGTS